MIHLGVYLAVTISLMALFLFVGRFVHRDTVTVRRRMAETFGKAASQDDSAVVNALYKDPKSLTMTVGAETVGLFEQKSITEPKRTLWERFDSLLNEANLSIRPAHFVLMAQLFGLAVALIGYLAVGRLAAAGAWIVGSLVPFVFLHMKRTARRQKFLRQLPNAFDLMARVLRAGQSVPQAMQAVADAFDDPVASAFAQCQQQQIFGLRPEIALKEMADRSGILELRIFVMAMVIQRQIGGNLSEVLERLSVMIRARLRLRQQIQTLTAEGRLQGWTLVVLPIVMFFVVMFVNRQYAQVLLDHPGWLAATGSSMAIGVLWIRTIVRIEA